MKPIPYGKQQITDDDINAVVQVLKSDFLTQGPSVKEFENAFANYIGCKYAIAVANGTAALHLSVLALNIQPGDKVITTPITFAASANCVKYCGGDIVFADIDPETYLLNVSEVKKLLEASPLGTYKGIIPVDFAGRSVNMEEFRKLANEYNLWILEDACHAPGGFFINSKNEKTNCGNGEYADLSVFSFHPVKHIATGEGGMITTNNKQLYDKLLLYRTHGITRDEQLMQENHGGWYYEMVELGFNYRLTDFQAALGTSQLKRAHEGLNIRREIASFYNKTLSSIAEIKRHCPLINGHAYHLYIIETDRRLELYNYLKANNIHTQIHYIPLHLMPYYKKFGWKKGDLPFAENYYEKCLSLPMYPSLKPDELAYVTDTIKLFFQSKA